ncbi:MAG: PilZ domain-containing protein [Thermodesulfobacteriota bacterium]
MADSDIEIVRDPAAVSRIFELMLTGRKPLGLVQRGERSDAWVVKMADARLILAKRDKGTKFTAGTVELQFRCPLGRNIAGKSKILRQNEEYLELALPAEIAIIQRRHAYRVVPTADSVAIFQTAGNWLLSGRIEDLSTTGILVRLPQDTPITVPCDINTLWMQFTHLVPVDEFTPPGTVERFLIMLKAATIVRKADNGKTRLAAYGIKFEPTLAEERQLARVTVSYARAARAKGVPA